MRILLVGSLSWNPERIRSLAERGHKLWGLWSRSMAWDQGPYPALDGCVQPIALHDAARTIREQQIDCVYGLFQVYDSRHWAPPTQGVEHGVWTLLHALLLERQHGAFDAPVVWHSGFDVQSLDLDVAGALDGLLVCNHQKLTYWITPTHEGGCGLDSVGSSEVVEFLDSDRPKLEFMNHRFAEPLSDRDGEIHTVCIGRPFNLDYIAAAERGIHVHVYGNSFDDVYRTLARDLSPADARRRAELLRRYLHVHPSFQTIGAPWAEVSRTKERWVEEFSRFDAGWSYIGSPFRRPPLDDRAAIANRVGTYLLAGLPVITDRRPEFFRYEELRRLGVAIELEGSDYDGLHARLRSEVRTREKSARAREVRAEYSFDASIDPLLSALRRARESYFARSHGKRSRLPAAGRSGLVYFDRSPKSGRASGRWRRCRFAWKLQRLGRSLGPLVEGPAQPARMRGRR